MKPGIGQSSAGRGRSGPSTFDLGLALGQTLQIRKSVGARRRTDKRLAGDCEVQRGAWGYGVRDSIVLDLDFLARSEGGG